MKTKTAIALTICLAILASVALSVGTSAYDSKYKFVVEQSSNLFPMAATGYEDPSDLLNDDDEMAVTAMYRIYAPGYKIVELAVELTYDEEILEFSGDYEPTAVGTASTATIIPTLRRYGETSFDDYAESGVEGRGKMTAAFSGEAEAFNQNGLPIVLVRAPFVLSDEEANLTNIDLHITTLVLRKIADDFSDEVDMAKPDGEGNIYVVENGSVNEENLDIITLSTLVTPSGANLIDNTPDNDTLTINFSSDFCPDLPSITAKVGELVTVKIPAPRDLDITYLFWLLRHDENVLGSRAINTFSKGEYGEAHIGDNYTYEGGYAYQYIEKDGAPLHLNKGDVMIEITFKVLAPGETTITFEANTEKGNTHKLTIDMGGFEDDYVYDVEDGANAYDAIFGDHFGPIGILKKKNGIYYEQVSILNKPLSEVESIDEYMFTPLSKILDFEVHEDTTLYAVWTKYVNKVNIVIEPPIAGERTSDIKVQTAHGNTYRIRTNQPKVSFKDSEGCVYFNGVWYAGYTLDENGLLHLTLDNAPFEAGKYYFARIYIDADIGYMLTAAEKT